MHTQKEAVKNLGWESAGTNRKGLGELRGFSALTSKPCMPSNVQYQNWSLKDQEPFATQPAFSRGHSFKGDSHLGGPE